jgi:aspartyl protease family protein
MTSGTRHIINEAILWLSVFIIAFVAFFYLDDRIGAFLEQRAENHNETANASEKTALAHEKARQADAPKQEITGFGRVVLHAGRSGHFEVKAYINDNSINLLADTGATYVVLTYADAQTLGLTDDLEFSGRARTANGVSRVAPIMLDSIEVGDIQVNNVQAVVAEEGKMLNSLLGMSFIGRLESFQMSGRELTLVQ